MAVALVSDPPSPYCHQKVVTVPSGSLDPEPSKVTATPATPVLSGPAFAVGVWFGLVVLVVDVEVLDDVDKLVVDEDVLELLEELVVVVLVVDVVALAGLAAHAGSAASNAHSAVEQ
jgi:hypothetical protein